MSDTQYPFPGLQANNVGGSPSVRLMAYAKYNFAVDGGTAGLITPAVNTTIPANAIITNVIVRSETAAAGTGATIALGTSAGSAANSLLHATAITSFTGSAMVQAIPVPDTASTWVVMSASGSITVTIATANLTQGVFEVFVEYTLATA